MLTVGLLFKVGAAPFQAWMPDVYQGAPTAVTAFMAACTKVAAFGAILRVVYVGVEANRWDWRGGVIAVAATARNGARAGYSNYGSRIAIAAPGGGSGGGILSTLNAGLTTPGADSYATFQGTSMATAHVTGVAALVWPITARPA